jgi:hypothetical protein
MPKKRTSTKCQQIQVIPASRLLQRDTTTQIKSDHRSIYQHRNSDQRTTYGRKPGVAGEHQDSMAAETTNQA